MTISEQDLAIFIEEESAWKVVAGDYRLSVGFNSRDLTHFKEFFIPTTTTTKVSDCLKPESGKIFIE
jgi:hypothetical protein